MITLKKDKQYLSVIKTVKKTNTEKCIGIYDFSQKKWTDEAPFIKNEMRGQSYVGFLKLLVNLEEADWWISRSYPNEMIEWLDYLSSLSIYKNNLEDISYDLFQSTVIKEMFENNKTKEIKKEISKNLVNLHSTDEILAFIITNTYAIKGKLGEKEWINEIYLYYKMNRNACGHTDDIDFENFNKYYFNQIFNLKREGLTDNNIETFLRIKYFQGATSFISDNTLLSYFKAIKLLNKEVPTGNFLMNYRTVMLEYYDNLDRIESEQFTNMQNEIDLHFTRNDYSIFIPQTKADCVNYGNIFGNCLGGFEWNNYLKNGQRYVVIIMKDNKPIICCDIDRRSKEIVQYLTFKNKRCDDDEAYIFKKEYQTYLLSLR